MKKQVIILILLLPGCVAAQNPHFPKIKITAPCSDEFINHYKGKWLIHEPININEYHDEVMRRLNAMNDLIRQIYQQPTGGDAGWSGEFTKTSFADEVKYVPVKD